MNPIALLVSLALGCASFAVGVEIAPPPGEPEVEAIPAKYAAEKKIRLLVEIRVKAEGSDRHSQGVRLINPTAQAIHFTGYSEKSPWYRIQLRREGKWVEHKVGWFCGTGLRPCVIEPGMSAVIAVSLKSDLHPLRIGVEYSNQKGGAEDQVVWSEIIEN